MLNPIESTDVKLIIKNLMTVLSIKYRILNGIGSDTINTRIIRNNTSLTYFPIGKLTCLRKMNNLANKPMKDIVIIIINAT